MAQPDLFSMVKVSSEISTENVEISPQIPLGPQGCVLASKFVYVCRPHAEIWRHSLVACPSMVGNVSGWSSSRYPVSQPLSGERSFINISL